MLSLLEEALEWLDRAEQAREVAGQLTDPVARRAVLELAESFDRLTRAAATPAVARRRDLVRPGQKGNLKFADPFHANGNDRREDSRMAHYRGLLTPEERARVTEVQDLLIERFVEFREASADGREGRAKELEADIDSLLWEKKEIEKWAVAGSA